MKVIELFEDEDRDPLILGLIKRLVDKGETVKLNIVKFRFPTQNGIETVWPAYGKVSHVGKDDDRYALTYQSPQSRNLQMWMMGIGSDLDELLDIKKIEDGTWEVVNAPQ